MGGRDVNAGDIRDAVGEAFNLTDSRDMGVNLVSAILYEPLNTTYTSLGLDGGLY